MMHQASRLASAFILATVLLSGCATSDKFKVMENKGTKATLPVRVMVPDFEDGRGREEKYYRGTAQIPLNFYGGYFFYDRHDSKYPTIVIPFPKMMAQEMAERLNEAGTFTQVDYVAADTPPAIGSYDVILKGKINRLRTRGRLHYWGLTIFGDYLHYLWAPQFHRRWELDMEYQLVDAYTGDPIGEPVSAQLMTTRRYFTRYESRGKIDDLNRKITPILDEYVASTWTGLPDANDPQWTTLKERGAQIVSSQVAQSQAVEAGRKPRFRFLSPTDGDTVRGATVPLRWDAVAPGKLKSAMLVVNNETVNLGINPLDLATVASAPSEVQPRDVNVSLKLGTNRLEAMVEDHIGEQARTSITINRLPVPLVPASRYAMVVGTGSPSAEKSVASVREVLVDPMYGQFPADRVQTVTGGTATSLTSALTEFGAKPLAGDLVLLYVATTGSWDNMTIMGSDLPVDSFMETAGRSFATNNVIVVLDVDWGNSPTNQELEDRLKAPVPQGWALLAAQSTGGKSPESGGSRLFADQFVATMRGTGDANRLTVERLFDDVITGYEQKAGGQAVPEVYGRYNRSNTMAERE